MPASRFGEKTKFKMTFPKRKQHILFTLLAVGVAILIALLLFPTIMSRSEQGLNTSRADSAISKIPVVQMLVPGFSVRELPLDLPNINVIRYGSDGRLYALAYDGHIFVLTDTDGDGLEETATPWWGKDLFVSPVGMALTDQGIYVTSLNRLSLLKDTDHDGIGDTEEIIASDWDRSLLYTGNSSGGVDAMGVAKDQAGNIYFALGAANFTNAYVLDSLGKSHYSLNSQRGTILKIPAGSNRLEIHCTGTRFPVALAFNKEGDLFASEQEGATWLPNGNPYDELLHIEAGRHYGFPPRHPTHLPGVIDEPSVFNYKPQHQSTCGLTFNGAIHQGHFFGPEFWQGDALVSGYSRGKLYRTKLVKTAAGYVANNAIIASISALTVDACNSAEGDLVVATHSGFPDWGYGPNARGKLYKISYTDKEQPIPVMTWAPKADEVRVAFDRPLNAAFVSDLLDNAVIEYGEYVAAGDRFEVLRPGYRAVERQQSFPRNRLQVKSAELSSNSQTIILKTDTHAEPVTYALTLPSFQGAKKIADAIAQWPFIDLMYRPNGVEVIWKAKTGLESLTSWLPHFDFAVNKAFMEPTAEYGALSEKLKTTGTLKLRTKLDLWNMLRPDTQPESTLDYQVPAETVHVHLCSSSPLEVVAPGAEISTRKKGQLHEAILTFSTVEQKAYDVEVLLQTGSGEPDVSISFTTQEDDRPRPLQAERFYLPWITEVFSKKLHPRIKAPQLAGGNWTRGERLFFGAASCGSCHVFNGKGKAIGPDLSNLIFRDYESVLRDIQQPSAAINPDYLAHSVTLIDGKVLVGMLAYHRDSLIIRDISGKRTAVAKKDVKSSKALATSLMPPGLDRALGPEKMRDLMTYLLTRQQPAVYQRDFGVGQVRNKTEVDAVLGVNRGPADRSSSAQPLHILWVSGKKDHGVDEHDYPLQQERWVELLELADQTTITTTDQWPTPAQFNEADVIVFYWNFPQFDETHGKQLDEYLRRGGGLVYLHWAVDGGANPQALADRIGLAWKNGSSRYRHGDLTLDFKDNKHPITAGFESTLFLDEVYWELVKGNSEIHVLATTKEAGGDQPMIWTTEKGKGRVFVSLLGHFNWTFDDPLFRILLLRGLSWSANQPVDRFENIVLMGARVSK